MPVCSRLVEGSERATAAFCGGDDAPSEAADKMAAPSGLTPPPPKSPLQSNRESAVALSPAQLQVRAKSSHSTASWLLHQARAQIDMQMRFKTLLQVWNKMFCSAGVWVCALEAQNVVGRQRQHLTWR